MTDYLDRTPSNYRLDGGRLWGWGYGSAGALGDLTSVNKSSPVQVSTLNNDWKTVSAFYHSLAVKYDGTLWSWGYNNVGQLGDGTVANKSSPVAIGANTNWKLVIAGHYGSAAIKSDDTLWVWGNNAYGQLANNTDLTHRSSPVQELTAGSWKAVGYGRFHIVGIKTDGTLWAWGHNQYGELGDNSVTHRSSPVQEVLANTIWQSVSCGRWFTLATRTDGTLWVWGENGDGQLGKSDRVHRSSPVQEVSGGTNWTVVSGGYYHSAGIKTDGTLWTWGRGGNGRLGNGSTSGRSSPAQTIIEGTDWKTVAAAGWHSAAVKTDGTMWTFGANDKGNLGNEDVRSVYSPMQIDTPDKYWKDVSADGETTIGMTEAQQDLVAGEKVYFNDDTFSVVGMNIWGELGDGTTASKSSRIQLTGGDNNWKSIGGGINSSYAIKTDGTLWVWGANASGQLGDNTRTHRSSPVQTVAGGTNWKFAKGGGSHTIGLKKDGTLWTWGNNANGQLGRSDLTHRSSPIQEITSGTSWIDVTCGDNFVAAMKSDNSIWLWGNNANGQLGRLDLTHRSSPIQEILANTLWKKVDAGQSHVLAVRLDGTLWVWGHNSEGQLGDGGITNKSSPVQITGTTWDQISAGRYFSTAIKTTGELWVWGHNGDGQLGTNNQTKYSSPVQTVSGGTNWKISKAHGRHCSAIKTDNTLWLWGWNEYGELGDGTTTHRSSPVQIAVSPNNEWVLTSGYYSTMFIEREKYNRQTNALVTKEYIIDVYPNLSNQFKSAGLWGWGDNSNGELGDGITTHRSSPIQTIAGGTNWKTGSTAYGHTAMIKTDGTLWSWGRGGSGQLGDLTRTTKSSPVQESSLNTLWKTVSCGRYHSAAVRSNGTLWSWGLGTIGQLGINANGAAASRSSPVQEVLASTLWKMVSCGSYFTAAVRTNGTLWAWGMNTNGQLGKNDVTHRSSPVQEVLANTKWKMVSSGAYHAAATRSDGTLWTWGRNTNGQLGKNDVVHRSSPVQEVTAGTTWTTVACGGYHTAGIKSDGTLWAWGQGSSGQLGDNSITSKSSPVQTLTAGTNWKQIIGGQNFSAAIKTDGTLWAWGHNDYGQLGQSDNVHRSSPIQVGTANYNWTKIMGENRAYRIMAIRDDSEDLY